MWRVGKETQTPICSLLLYVMLDEEAKSTVFPLYLVYASFVVLVTA